MQLREGETVGEYITRLESRVAELEPPEGFTVQEWHIGQVYTYLLWRGDHRNDFEAMKAWSARVIMFEDRFPEATKKFKAYMGWQSEKPDALPD